eukprot:m.249720 g.249720  ORF g.249720 m.249720 type:complete len:430 (+) comp19089_c0_seq12:1290-2579(+)
MAADGGHRDADGTPNLTSPITPEQVDTFKGYVKEWVPRLLALADDEESFRFLADKNGITMGVGSEEGVDTSLLLLRARTTFHVPHDLMQPALVMADSDRFTKVFDIIDPMFHKGKVLWMQDDYVFPEVPFLSLKWAKYTLPALGILQDREFVFLEHDDEFEIDGQRYGIGVAQSVELPQLPECKMFVRGDLMISGYVFKEVSEGVIESTYVLQANPKGIIPAWAVNLGLKEQGMNLGRMRDWLEGLELTRQRMADLELVADVQDDLTKLQDVTLGRRGQYSYEFATAPGTEVVFAFCSLGGPVTFHLQGTTSGSGFSKPASKDSHEEAIHAKVVAASNTVTLCWQNSNWVRQRPVYFTVRDANACTTKSEKATKLRTQVAADGAAGASTKNAAATPQRLQGATQDGKTSAGSGSATVSPRKARTFSVSV